jgi:hypothetical protein
MSVPETLCVQMPDLKVGCHYEDDEIVDIQM